MSALPWIEDWGVVAGISVWLVLREILHRRRRDGRTR